MRLRLIILAILWPFALQLSFGQKRDFKTSQESISATEIVVKVSPQKPNSRSQKPSLDLKHPSNSPFSREGRTVKALTDKDSSSISNIYQIQLNEGENPAELIERLKQYSNIVYAEPVFEEQLLHLPNDPMAQPSSNDQWYLEKIRAYDAWDISKSSNNIIIGISDTGVDFDHEDISPKIFSNTGEIFNEVDDDENGWTDDVQGYDFADNDGNPQCASDFHGNRVAGLAGAATNNGIGMAGVGYNALISPLKVFRDAGGSSSAYSSIIYAAENDYDIINLSWGSTSGYNQFAQDIINYAVLEHDLIVIAAAGNENTENLYYPASYDNVLSVSWTDANDNKAGSASYNYSVDLVAPGQGIISSDAGNSYQSDNGSSYASPMVSGAAALVKHHYPWLNARQTMELLRVTTDDIYSVGSNETYEGKLGSGRLNIYKALTADSIRSVRIVANKTKGQFGDYIFFDDSLSLDLDLISHLLPVRSGIVELSSSSPYLNISSEPAALTFTDSMQERSVSLSGIYISPETPPGSQLPLRVNFSEGSYEDFQYVIIETSPDYLDFSNEKMALSVAGNGDLGFPRSEINDGLGLTLNGTQIAEEISIAIGNSTSMVADNLFISTNSTSRNNDFSTSQYIKLRNHETADHFASNSFTSTMGLPLAVEQNTYGFTDQDFIILEYRFTNTSSDSVKNLNSGIYLDWILESSRDRASYDPTSSAVISHRSDETLYSGVKIFGEPSPIHQSIDLGLNNDNAPDVDETFSDSLKYRLLSETLFDSAGYGGDGNDISQMISTPSWNLAPYASKKVTFLIATGTDLSQLRSTFEQAELSYESIRSLPPLADIIYSCNGDSVVINPTGGNNYRFYTDPIGENLITENTNITTGELSQDTIFYVENIDQNYATPIQRVEVQVIENPTAFTISPDTLYLDGNANIASFIDQSHNPFSWLWNFGNGTLSSKQNPQVGYTSTGNYQISLYTESLEGCEGTFYQNLVVATRPTSTNISDTTFCVGGSYNVQLQNGDSLAVYSNAEATNQVFIGTTFAWNNIEKDTVLYFRRIKNKFKSSSQPVSVTISKPTPAFRYKIDPDSNGSQMLFINNTPNSSSAQWTIDGVGFIGDTAVVSVSSSAYQIQLGIENSYGCTGSLEQQVTLQTSATPDIETEIFSCFGETLTLEPSNGELFGFYTDPDLNSLITIGTFLQLDSVVTDTEIYVAGLDKVLPSEPVKTTISVSNPNVAIATSPETLYLSENQNATFSVVDDLTNIRWSLNGKTVGTQKSIILFLNTAGTYTVGISGKDSEGCNRSSEIAYMVELKPPLTTQGLDQKISVSPNPSNGKIRISGMEENYTVTIYDLSGKIHYQMTDNAPFHIADLRKRAKGVYVIHVETKSNPSKTTVVLQ